MISRPLIPGEMGQFRRGLQNEKQFLNRLHLGQINSVDEDNGTLDVWVFDIGDLVTVEIPMAGMSIDRTSSSWIRYMPTVNAFVLISYSSANQPYCEGYALLGNDPRATGDPGPNASTGVTPNSGKFVPHIGGYRALRLAKEASDLGSTDTVSNPDGTSSNIPIGLRDFIPLRSGEWDMRSSGGAYIKGSRFGQLTLSASQDFLVIDKTRDEISTHAGLHKFSHGGPLTDNGISVDPVPNNTQARIGDVKRLLLPLDSDDEVPLPTSGREWLLHVDQPTTVPSVGIVYDERIGDIWSDGPIPIPDPLHVVKKQLTKGPPEAPINMFKFTVDLLGNVEIDHGPSAVLVTLTGLTTALTATYAGVNIDTTVNTSLFTTGITSIESVGLTNVNGSIVQLGAPPLAIHPSVHGDVLLTFLTSLMAAITTLTTIKSPPTSPDPAYVGLIALQAAFPAILPPGPTGLTSVRVLVE